MGPLCALLICDRLHEIMILSQINQDINMYHVIYNKTTFALYGVVAYSTAAAAKAVRTKAIKRGLIEADQWEVASKEEWRARDPMVTVISLMSGKSVEIRMSQKGNPALDPSMEGYWQM